MTYRIGLRSLVVLVVLVVVCFASGIAHSQVRVKGYTRKNGTYVAPHYRSRPDGNFSNNWSTKGNINPYTGKEGTRITPPTSYDGYPSGGSYSSGSFRATYVPDYGSTDWFDNPYYTGPIPNLRTPTNPTEKRVRQIAAIDYHGIGFSTTQQQFLRRFPDATLSAPRDPSGVISYAIDDIDGKRDSIYFQFLGDEFPSSAPHGRPRLVLR